MKPDKGAAFTLLRSLAGRVPDGYLQDFRGYVASAEWKAFATALSGYLVDGQVAFTENERRLLDDVVGPGVAENLPELAAEPPAYRFRADGPEPSNAEGWLASVAPRVPGVRRVVAAYREPADEAAIPLATWVYLVEVDAGTDVALVQNDLRVGAPSRGVVEVFAVGEGLPRYHLDALRAGRTVWARPA